ncbi:MAG: SdrD B-like domain-containing protein [Bacteroidia bacterium]
MQDASESGINGVTVMLKNAAGDTLASTTTATNGATDGYYEFTGLRPGDYVVCFGDVAGYSRTVRNNTVGDDPNDSDAGPNGVTGTINLVSGEFDPTNDAGYWQPASLGDFVWLDDDGDGEQDPTEPGVAGVTVYLCDASGNILDSTLTDANGAYSFEDLLAGTYAVKFGLPAGYAFTNPNAAADTDDSDADQATGKTPTTTLAPGDNDPTLDAGIYQPASLGDYVWNDADRDGVQDPGEGGINGVKVILKDEAGAKLDSTQTATNGSRDGYYRFDGLAPGSYDVCFAAPAGYVPTLQLNSNNDDPADSDMDPAGLDIADIVLSSGENDPTNDAGFYLPSSIGDQVWKDQDGDDVQDPGEPGVPNVYVSLYDCSGNLIARDTTDANGNYLFDDLFAGDYYVVFDIAAQPVACVFVNPFAGSDRALDSDANPATGQSACTTLDPGEHDSTVDAGLVALASLGDYVWKDLDGDGQQDPASRALRMYMCICMTEPATWLPPTPRIRTAPTALMGCIRAITMWPLICRPSQQAVTTPCRIRAAMTIRTPMWIQPQAARQPRRCLRASMMARSMQGCCHWPAWVTMSGKTLTVMASRMQASRA